MNEGIIWGFRLFLRIRMLFGDDSREIYVINIVLVLKSTWESVVEEVVFHNLIG